PPGRPALGAPLGGGPVRVPRRQRDRDDPAAARRAGGRGPAARVRLVILGVRRPARPAAPRGAPPAAHLAVRGLEARRRALLRELLPALRAGDRGAPVLQRLRPPPGPELR